MLSTTTQHLPKIYSGKLHTTNVIVCTTGQVLSVYQLHAFIRTKELTCLVRLVENAQKKFSRKIFSICDDGY